MCLCIQYMWPLGQLPFSQLYSGLLCVDVNSLVCTDIATLLERVYCSWLVKLLFYSFV